MPLSFFQTSNFVLWQLGLSKHCSTFFYPMAPKYQKEPGSILLGIILIPCSLMPEEKPSKKLLSANTVLTFPRIKLIVET